MTTPAHSERIAAIEARLTAATPGPWSILDSTNYMVEAHAGSLAADDGARMPAS